MMLLKFKNSPKDNKINFYSRYNNQDLNKAISTLSGSAFKLYIYLGMYKEHPHCDISTKQILTDTGFSSRTYYYALKELRDTGYLVSDNTSSYLLLEGTKMP